jgi:hypothetical protein
MEEARFVPRCAGLVSWGHLSRLIVPRRKTGLMPFRALGSVVVFTLRLDAASKPVSAQPAGGQRGPAYRGKADSI